MEVLCCMCVSIMGRVLLETETFSFLSEAYVAHGGREERIHPFCPFLSAYSYPSPLSVFSHA